jgi:hypothetical protein
MLLPSLFKLPFLRPIRRLGSVAQNRPSFPYVGSSTDALLRARLSIEAAIDRTLDKLLSCTDDAAGYYTITSYTISYGVYSFSRLQQICYEIDVHRSKVSLGHRYRRCTGVHVCERENEQWQGANAT